MVGAVPTTGGTGTQRGPARCLYGLHTGKGTGHVPRPHRAPYSARTVARMGPVPFNPYRCRTVLPVWAPYRFGRTSPVPFCPYRSRTVLPVPVLYRFTRSGPVLFCTHVALTTPYQPIPPPYRFARTGPVQFCPYRSRTVLLKPVPYRFALMLPLLPLAPSWSRLLHPFLFSLTSSFSLPVLSTIFHSKNYPHDTSVLHLLSYSLFLPNQPFSCIYLQHSSSLYSSSCSLRSPSDPACLPCAASRVGGGWDPGG